jgi:hypothetical protein
MQDFDNYRKTTRMPPNKFTASNKIKPFDRKVIAGSNDHMTKYSESGLKLAGTIVACLVLSACGSEYIVTKLPGPEVSRVLPEKGIYYSLPRTEVVLRIPVTETVVTPGRLHHKFSENVEACKLDGNAVPDIASPEPKYTYTRGRAQIFTRAIPDPDHRYRLDVNAGIFSSFSHTIEVTSQGLFSSADTTVTDAKTSAAFAAANAVVDVVKLASGVPGLAAKGPPDCQEFLALATVLDERDKLIEPFVTNKKDLLLSRGLASRPETIQKTIDFLDAEIAGLKKKYKKKIAPAMSEKKVSMFALFGKTAPADFSEHTSDTIIWTMAELEPVAPKKPEPALPGIANATTVDTLVLVNPEAFNKVLTDWNVKINVTPNIAYSGTCGVNVECKDQGPGGYRYRLAASGDVVVSVTVKVKGKADIQANIARATVPVAQYGPVAQLPSKFGGLEGNVNLSLFTDSGTLKKVTVGAKPLPASTITDASGLFTKTIRDFRTAKSAESAARTAEEKAEADAAANAEVNALKREKELLELKKAVRDLKAALGEDDE